MPEKITVTPMVLELRADRKCIHILTTINGTVYGCRLEPNECLRLAFALETMSAYLQELNRAGAAEQTDAGKPEKINITGSIGVN